MQLRVDRLVLAVLDVMRASRRVKLWDEGFMQQLQEVRSR